MVEPESLMSPSENLVLEVLAARYRLGENLWTFESRHGRTLTKLEERGLVWTMHGIVEKTIRAGLTESGITTAISSTYSPPVVARLTSQMEGIHESAVWAEECLTAGGAVAGRSTDPYDRALTYIASIKERSRG